MVFEGKRLTLQWFNVIIYIYKGMEKSEQAITHRIIELINTTNERIDIANERIEIAERANHRLFLLVVIETIAIGTIAMFA